MTTDRTADARWAEADRHSEARIGARVVRRYDYHGMPSVPGDVYIERTGKMPPSKR